MSCITSREGTKLFGGGGRGGHKVQWNKKEEFVVSWEPKGAPQCHVYPQEIAGLIKGLLTIGFP